MLVSRCSEGVRVWDTDPIPSLQASRELLRCLGTSATGLASKSQIDGCCTTVPRYLSALLLSRSLHRSDEGNTFVLSLSSHLTDACMRPVTCKIGNNRAQSRARSHVIDDERRCCGTPSSAGTAGMGGRIPGDWRAHGLPGCSVPDVAFSSDLFTPLSRDRAA